MSVGMDLREKKFLIGDIESQILGNKLLSNGQVIKVLLYVMEKVNLRQPVRNSARLVFKEVKIFWQKARLPVQHESRCLDKIVKLHKDYTNLKKNKGQLFNLAKEEKFVSEMNNLFDISHGNILDDLEDGDPRKDFFLAQKEDGRIGFINNVESLFDKLEEQENRKQQMLCQRLARSEIEMNKLGKCTRLLFWR